MRPAGLHRAAVWSALAVLVAGCPDESLGPRKATPLPRATVPIDAPPPTPSPKVPAPEPKVAAPPVPAAPKGPAGLTRAKVGDAVEFSWTRTGEVTFQPAQMMAMVGGAPPDPEKVKRLATPLAARETGSLSITRVAPPVPFTFLVEIKLGKDSGRWLFAYSPDIALEEVFLRTDPEVAPRPQKVAGTSWDAVETATQLVSPGAAALALSGGLLRQSAPEQHAGAISIELTRAGPRKPATGPEPAKVLETFETPLTIALKQVQRFGQVDPAAREEAVTALRTALVAAASPCLSKELSPRYGALEAVFSAGKVDSLEWDKQAPPKGFDKCVRDGLRKAKLPAERTVMKVELDASGL